MLPFTREQFFAVFAGYNNAVWPAQVAAYVLGLGIVLPLVFRSAWRDRTVALGLALMWLWTGVVYHWLFFASINKAALLFGALFVVQAGIFVYAAVAERLTFALPRGPAGWLGAGLVLYAAVFYPLLGLWAGHAYPEMPMFGVTPCPVTLFTFGLLLVTTARVPPWVLIVPVVWSLIGGSAAFALGVPQDWPLLLSGVVTVVLLVIRDRRRAGVAGAHSA
jgi:hypothetical protein